MSLARDARHSQFVLRALAVIGICLPLGASAQTAPYTVQKDIVYAT